MRIAWEKPIQCDIMESNRKSASKCCWNRVGESSRIRTEVIGNQKETKEWEQEILKDTKNIIRGGWLMCLQMNFSFIRHYIWGLLTYICFYIYIYIYLYKQYLIWSVSSNSVILKILVIIIFWDFGNSITMRWLY